ncbi:hypothetical protein J2793_000739 [Paraburkholderia caledonica]|uniref:Uncharacterized protein n=1 Tax=Paraburkholderia caledonica TaxID=134536 RepID=A0AB73IAJ7_9BURK|nr:hypothetical protein [Paraburkholderia caledonica]MDR7007862.1 hypothetical protein [Paraburkholderia strydomiana]
MEAAETEKREGKVIIISPRAGVCPTFASPFKPHLECRR